MVFDNVRTETMNRGDMNAMMAACQLGRERFLRLVERYGVDTVMTAAYDWMDYSEKMLRDADREDPGRRVRGADRLARRRRAQPRRAAARGDEGDRRGRQITIDVSGSNAEVPTGYNVPLEGSLLVGAYYVIRTLLLDEATFPEHVPQNDGMFRPWR